MRRGMVDAITRRLTLFIAFLLSGGHVFLSRPLLLALFFLAIALVPRQPLLRLHRLVFLPLGAIFLVIGLEALRSSADLSNIVSRSGHFLAGLLVLNMYLLHGREAFARDFSALVSLFPYQAILTVLLGLVVPGAFFAVPGTEVQTFAFLFYHHAEPGVGGPLVRPDGFFWEPGILQFYLNLGLFLAVRSGRGPLTLLAFAMAILLTQSTTGVVILALQLGVLALRYLASARFSARRMAGALFLAVALLPVGFYAARNIEEKLTGEASGSFYARNFDSFAGFQVALEEPWLGIGFNTDYYISRIQQYDIDLGDFNVDLFNDERGNTNGILMLFYTMGFPLGLLAVLSLVRQTMVPSDFVVPMILFLSMLTEPLTLTPLFLCFLFSAVVRLHPAGWPAAAAGGHMARRLEQALSPAGTRVPIAP
jgi:hypothetical protein